MKREGLARCVRRRPHTRRILAEALECRLLLTSVVSLDPSANSNSAPPSTDVSVTFDQLIDGATATPQTFAVSARQHGRLVAPTAAVTTSGVEATLAPAINFFPGEVVQATITSSVQDTTGGAATPHVWEFRTAVTAGSGFFADTSQTLGNLSVRDVAVGDLDRDGDLDAVGISFYGPGKIWVNDGFGNFTDSGQIGSDATFGVALGDVDGDGYLDAFFARQDAPDTVWINDRFGGFYDSGQMLGDSYGVDVSLGDLDGDGDLDAFVVNRTHGVADPANKVWLNQGGAQGGTAGVFSDSGQMLGNSNSRDVALGDLDGDGDLDAFVANSYLETTTQANTVPVPNKVWLNQGGAQGGTAGVFADSGQILGDDVLSERVALGDLDGDGDLDAFVANGGYKSYPVPSDVWMNDGQAVFEDHRQQLGISNARGLSLGDLDGDGDLDALVTHSGSGTFGATPWLNDGGTFHDSGHRFSVGGTFGVDLGDLDGDGDLDAILGQNLCGNGCVNTAWLNLPSAPTAVELASDGFEAGGFDGGSGQWSSGAWTAAGDAAVSANSPLSGSKEARLRRSTGDLRRTVDTSAVSGVKLSFWSRLQSFDGADKAWVKTSTDGSNWTTVMEFINGQDDNQYHYHELLIDSVAETLFIRFDAGMNSSTDYWYLDEIHVHGTLAVPPSQPPEIISVAILSAVEDSPYTYDVEAIDPDAGDVLTFSLSAAPSGMVIDSETGEIDWTPGNADVGTNPVTVHVADQTGAFAIQSFDISVANVNDAPSIDSSPVTAATVNSEYTYDVEASDPDVGDVLTYSFGNVPPVGMTIDSSSGLIQWTPTSTGTFPVTVLVEDNALASSSQSFSIEVSDAPPVATYTRDHSPGLPIPEQVLVTSTITALDSFAIADVTLSLNINHQRPSDLEIYLSHGATTVQLADISGGNLSAFNGADVNGDWVLEVRDTRKKKEGVLIDWAITVEGIQAAGVADSLVLGLNSDQEEAGSSKEDHSLSDSGTTDSPLPSDGSYTAFDAVDSVMADRAAESDQEEQLLSPLEEAIQQLLLSL